MENERSITDLPIEVLDLIFEELQSIVDKLQLAQVHEKLGKAFAYHSRSAFKKLTPFFGVTQELWVVLVSLCGSTVEEFSSRQIWNTPWSDILVETIEQHCPNLKSECVSGAMDTVPEEVQQHSVAYSSGGWALGA
ncbi:GD12355 [Drosophila simulans]|uniref:GD12355 n=1 Tax=Drosophila simulans TaxID=7240 RepID=B4QPD8_DROSI|nr:GD12355 [Drosophila simulans]